MKNNYSKLFILVPLLLGSFHVHATRYSPSGGSYNMSLNSNNIVLNTTPITGSDYNTYYSVAPRNQEGIVIDERTAQPIGQLKCKANYLLGNYSSGLPMDYAYHRVFSYMPKAGFNIKGLTAYRINANTFFTLYSSNGITNDWKRIPAMGCADYMEYVDTAYFTVQFPFEVRFYVKQRPIDGQIIFPGGTIAGYTRMFQIDGPPAVDVPVDKASVKLNMASSTINYPENCKSNIDNLSMHHGVLDAINFDDTIMRTVTYSCGWSSPVKVKITLDYTTDYDPEKRVPLTSGDRTIYSNLTIHDDQNNKSGKVIETTIDKVKNIRIESHLSGSYMQPGDYSGNAWLIATYM